MKFTMEQIFGTKKPKGNALRRRMKELRKWLDSNDYSNPRYETMLRTHERLVKTFETLLSMEDNHE